MNITRHSDTALNVIFPLLAGYFIYCLGSIEAVPLLVSNYLPDGLWAYSFASIMLIIWSRQLNFLWIVGCYLIAAGFELSQYWQLIMGTADMIDVLTYYIFISAGLLCNNYFKKRYFIKPI